MTTTIQSICNRLALAAALAVCTGHAAAGIVVYDEAVRGDAPSAFGPAFVGADVGTLSVGTSFILGIGEFGQNDDYIFTISAGTVLVGINLSMGATNMAPLPFGADLYSSDGTLISNQSTTGGVDVVGLGTFAFFGDALALGPGTYRIDNTNSGGRDVDAWPYRWDLFVESTSQVPEPASAWLVTLALSLFGTTQRRRGAR